MLAGPTIPRTKVVVVVVIAVAVVGCSYVVRCLYVV